MESALFELDTMGILRATKLPANLSWLDGLEGTLLVQILATGEDGLSKRRLKKMKEEGERAARRLELRDLVHWERDRFGQPSFLTLTWKGDEAAQTLLKVFKHRKPEAAATPPARGARHGKVIDVVVEELDIPPSDGVEPSIETE
jgi:hypothetical protein